MTTVFTSKKQVKDGKQIPVENYSPTLYVKVRYDKKRDNIITPFYEKGRKVVPIEYFNQRCYVKAAIIFDGIFIGNQTICLQLRVYEANVKKIENTHKRVLDEDESDGDSDSEDENNSNDEDY